MHLVRNKFAELVLNISWLEMVKALAPVITSIIAYKALRNWQMQDRAKREVEFLDQVLDVMNLYISELHRPVELVRMIKIGMECHIENWGEGSKEEKEIQGAIRYIEEKGEGVSQKLREALAVSEDSLSKLNMLIVKGQMFSFENYSTLRDAALKLGWHTGQIYTVSTMTEPRSWYWKNEEVISLLKKVMKIDPDEIKKSLDESGVTIVKFVRDTYKNIYGSGRSSRKRLIFWTRLKIKSKFTIEKAGIFFGLKR